MFSKREHSRGGIYKIAYFLKPGMLAYTFNPGSQQQMHEDLCEFSPAWSTDLQDSPEYRKTPSQGVGPGESLFVNDFLAEIYPG